MNNTALYAEQKWQKIVQQTEPVVATIEAGSFTPSDLTKLAALIRRQSELASMLFKKEVRALQIQAESYTSDVISKLHGAGIDASVGNVEKVIEKVFKLEIKKNLSSLMQKMRTEVSKQVESIRQTAKSFVVERKEDKNAKSLEYTKIKSITDSILKKLDAVPSELKKVIANQPKQQVEQKQPVVVENAVPNPEKIDQASIEAKIDSVAKNSFEKLSQIKEEIKEEIKGELANKVDRKPQAVKKKVEQPKKPLLSKAIENSKVLSNFTPRVAKVKERVIEKSKTIVNRVIEKAVSVKNNVKSGVLEPKNAWNTVSNDTDAGIRDAINSVKNAVTNNAIVKKIQAISNGLQSIFPAILNKISPIAGAMNNIVHSVKNIKGNIAYYVRRKTQGLKDAMAWVKNKTVNGWRKTKDFVSSVHRKLDDGFDFLMPIVGMGAMLYPVIKNVFDYFMEKFSLKDFLIDTFNSMFPELSKWLREKVPFLNKDSDKKKESRAVNRTDDGGYAEVNTDKDGNYTRTKYDYNPEPIKKGKYKGWVKTKEEGIIDEHNVPYKNVEFVNPKTKEVARESITDSGGTLSDESLYKGPEKAVVKGEDGNRILESGKHVEIIYNRNNNKSKPQARKAESVKPPVSVRQPVSVKPPQEATTKAPPFKKESASVEKPKVSKTEEKKSDTELKAQVTQPLNLNTTTKVGRSADTSLLVVDGNDF